MKVLKQFLIPELGEEITLAEDWTFTVINERRNQTLARYLGFESIDPIGPLGAVHYQTIRCHSIDSNGVKEDHAYKYYKPIKKTIKHTWPAGTILIIDRIYIRKGAKSYSSVTFKTKIDGKVIRFFARLQEVNTIIFR